MRIAADGFIDIRDGPRIRTPGIHTDDVDPLPEAEALSFLLSHSFPGHRRIVRSLRLNERRRIRLAAWASSVSERMGIADRVWRAITEPVLPPPSTDHPVLLQIIQFEHWAYPLYLDGSVTRVLPYGGLPAAELQAAKKEIDQLDLRTA